MNIQDTIRSISLDSYLLEGMVAHYCNQVELESATDGAALRTQVGGDEGMHRQALHAAADAVIFSQLAVSLLDDSEFGDALECRHSLDDKAFVAMRIALFAEGLSVACETAEGDEEVLSRAARRKSIAEEILSAGD